MYIIVDNPSIPCSKISHALVLCNLAKSLSDARRLIQQGGIYLNNIVVDKDRELSTDDLQCWKYLLFRRGKKTYSLISLNDVDKFYAERGWI